MREDALELGRAILGYSLDLAEEKLGVFLTGLVDAKP